MRNNKKKDNAFAGFVLIGLIAACAIVPKAEVDDHKRLELETCKLMKQWDEDRKAGIEEHMRNGMPVSKSQRERCEVIENEQQQ